MSFDRPIVPINHFQPVLDALAGKRIAYNTGYGWAGDNLITMGVRRMFSHIGAVETEWAHAEYFVWNGGGNLGRLWSNNYILRQQCFTNAEKNGIRVVVLPQTLTPGEKETFPENTTVFARERITRHLIPGSILAPDLALFLPSEPASKWEQELGVFIRVDAESCEHPELDGVPYVDPYTTCRTGGDLIALARKYRRIMTDRLHVAIAGLLCGREVSLFPNGYYKNHAMYADWLAKLGCRWCEDFRLT